MNPDGIVPGTIELQDYEVKPGTEVVVTGWGRTLVRHYIKYRVKVATDILADINEMEKHTSVNSSK
jgi:hypothetical protein